MGWKATAISLREMTATCTWILAAGGGGGPGKALPCGSDGKESACNAGDLGSIPGLGRSPGEEIGYPPQYSCLENFMGREASQAIVQGIAKSWTQLND